MMAVGGGRKKEEKKERKKERLFIFSTQLIRTHISLLDQLSPIIQITKITGGVRAPNFSYVTYREYGARVQGDDSKEAWASSYNSQERRALRANGGGGGGGLAGRF